MFRGTAHIYDLVYALQGKDYDAESQELVELITRHAPQAASLLDVACGTGGHLAHLRERFSVVGIDLDDGMLDQARARLPGIELVQADMQSFDLGRTFDAIVCLFSSIGYLADQQQLDAAIRRMADHLTPAGVLVVDGWVRPDLWRDDAGPFVVSGVQNGIAIARMGTSRREGVHTTLEFHHLIGTTDGIEQLVDSHVLTLFSDDDYARAFRQAGLEAEFTVGPMPGRSRIVGRHRNAAPPTATSTAHE